MQALRFFYDDIIPRNAAGLFSLWHLIFVLAFIAMLAIALFVCRHITEKQLQRFIWAAAIIVTIAEIVKISLRVSRGEWVDTWIPLYYCSLFLYAVWMSRCRIEWLSRMGYAYITMGGILAACLFTLYPSTSLAIYPAMHLASLHSFFYHLIMSIVGILILWKKLYVPKPRDAAFYGVFTFSACIIGYFMNELFGSNCMFLHNAYKLPVLDNLLNYSHGLYITLVVLAQCVGMYWLNYGLYTLVKKHKEKKEH